MANVSTSTAVPSPGQPGIADTLSAIQRAHELAASYLVSLPERPVGRAIRPAVLAAALDEPLPEHPSDPADAVAEWFIRAEPGIFASSGPRFFGFVNG
ncbi:MAG TPA: hypothetical protein VFL82_04380, partial [Thermomicrobiales bacterium]|nr:hypothetical protein [Thermomicrobiales bacterium]